MNDLERVREYFKNDLYATEQTGAVIEAVGKNYAKCSLTLRREHRNAMGGVMGGVYFTLADFTFAIAANADNPPTVSVSGQITYLGTAKGERLIAEARCLHAGRSGCAFIVTVSDELGNDVASVTFYGFRKAGDPVVRLGEE
jgi:acyl-CoA thioesterase